MRIAVVFDTPYKGFTPDDQLRQMEAELSGSAAEPEMEYQVAGALREKGHEVLLIGIYHDPREILDRCADWKPDLVMNCVEAFRNDDQLDYLFPALLEAGGHPYTGSPPLGLLVSRDKAMSKKILSYHGIRVPGFATWQVGESVEQPPAELRFPLIVKPLAADASAGIAQASVVEDLDALRERVSFVHQRFEQPAIAEEFIAGRELYASVVGNGDRLEILPLTELVFDKEKTEPEERIATQSAKWDEPYRKRKGIRNVFARPVSAAAREAIDRICHTAFRALWLRDYARIDLRLTEEGELWVLEANANPFLSQGHEIANAAEKAGMPYPGFIQRLVDEAMARYA